MKKDQIVCRTFFISLLLLHFCAFPPACRFPFFLSSIWVPVRELGKLCDQKLMCEPAFRKPLILPPSLVEFHDLLRFLFRLSIAAKEASWNLFGSNKTFSD